MSWIHTLGFSLSLCMLAYISGIGIKNIIRYNDFKIKYARVTQQLEAEKLRKQEFEYTRLDMETNTFWEVRAKEALGFKVKGEHAYKVKRNEK